jgi:hypothetical protein
VSVVVPVRNGARWIEACVRAVAAQQSRLVPQLEIIAVDDGSNDASPAILSSLAAELGVRLVAGGGRGAASAINAGILAARFPLIAQLDHDVVPEAGWLDALVAALDSDRSAAAAQGEYRARPGASVWERVTHLDLKQRWARIHGGSTQPAPTDHVCSGNTVYRREALEAVGGFDESLGYGYDNDLSYRLVAAGYRLLIVASAKAIHHWPSHLSGYLRQQYGQGYGRLDVVARWPAKAGGDAVSGAGMILHAAGMLVSLCGACAAALLALTGRSWLLAGCAAAAILAALALERFVAGLLATIRHRDAAGLAFVPAHLARDLAWAGAIVAWLARRGARRRPSPTHSMGDLR